MQECPSSAVIEQYKSVLVEDGQKIEQAFQEIISSAFIVLQLCTCVLIRLGLRSVCCFEEPVTRSGPCCT